MRCAAAAGLGEQVVRGGLAGGAHGGKDAPARGQDLQIGLALQAQLKLGGAVAGPDQVGVRVDEAGHDHPPAGVQGRFGGDRRRAARGLTRRRRCAHLDQHGAVRENAQAAQAAPALRPAGQGEELRGGMNQHGGIITPLKSLAVWEMGIRHLGT